MSRHETLLLNKEIRGQRVHIWQVGLSTQMAVCNFAVIGSHARAIAGVKGVDRETVNMENRNVISYMVAETADMQQIAEAVATAILSV